MGAPLTQRRNKCLVVYTNSVILKYLLVAIPISLILENNFYATLMIISLSYWLALSNFSWVIFRSLMSRVIQSTASLSLKENNLLFFSTGIFLPSLVI